MQVVSATAGLTLAYLWLLTRMPPLQAATDISYDHQLISNIHTADPTRFGVFHGTIAHHFEWNSTDASYGTAHFLYRAVRLSENQLQINARVYWEDAGEIDKAVHLHILTPVQWLHNPALQLKLYNAQNETAGDVAISTRPPWTDTVPLDVTATLPVAGAEDLRLRMEYEGQLWPQYIPIAPAVRHALGQPTLEGYAGRNKDAPTFLSVLRMYAAHCV